MFFREERVKAVTFWLCYSISVEIAILLEIDDNGNTVKYNLDAEYIRRIPISCHKSHGMTSCGPLDQVFVFSAEISRTTLNLL